MELPIRMFEEPLGTESSKNLRGSPRGINEELPGEFLDNFLGDPGKFQGVFRDSWTEYLVELPAGFLKQLAGKILKEVRWYSWMNSGKIPGETSDEFWKEHVSNFRWSSYGIPERNFEGVPG